MKRLFYITICAVLALISFSACTEPQEVKPETKLTITASKLDIPCKGGEATVVFESNATVTATVDREWCTCSLKDGSATFTAPANETLESRYAKATFKAGEKTVEVTIQQFGFLSVSFSPDDISAPSDKSEYSFPYSYEDPITASADQEWIHVNVTETALNISIDENTTQGTPVDRTRQGKVTWKLGVDSGVINVSQKNLSFMKVDDNWTVTYDGVIHDELYDEDAAVLTNTVRSPGVSGKYAIDYVEKSVVEASGLDLGDYIDQYSAPALKDLFDQMIELFKLFGVTMTYDDLLYEDTTSEQFNPFDKGKYYAFAVGFDSNCEVTGHYQFSEFEVKGQEKPKTGYESWIGEWQVPRGTSVDTWKVSKKESGKTFNVEGIERDPQSVGPVEAVYDSEKDALVIYGFADAKTVSTSYGNASVGLYGKYYDEADQKEYIAGWGSGDPYPIFTAVHNSDNTATLKPTTLSFSDGSTATLSKFGFFGKLLDGEYQGAFVSWSQDMTPLPNTITGEGGGGGDDPEGYDQWLGNWKIERLDYDPDTFEPTGGTVIDVWSITPNSSGSTYTISNFESVEDSYGTVTANFVASTGAMEIRSQILTTWDYYGQEVTEALYGIYIDPSDGEEYFTSAVDKVLATCTMTGSGADVKPGEYSGTVFTQMQHLQMVGGDAYVHNAFGYMLPNTLAPSGSSSSVHKTSTTSRIVMSKMTDASKAVEKYELYSAKEVRLAVPYHPTKFRRFF